jgi:superfamily II DNA or RNA helicase
MELRKWQIEALSFWEKSNRRGILEVATGGGKTFFALKCIEKYQNSKHQPCVVIAVPTQGLLEQWTEEIVGHFNVRFNEIHFPGKKKVIKKDRINIGIFNSLAKSTYDKNEKYFLIVDECHKIPSKAFAPVLLLPKDASLGLSATPGRQYDTLMQDLVIPALGPVIYKYSIVEGFKDGILSGFELRNIVFKTSPENENRLNALTRQIAINLRKDENSDIAKRLLIKRARIANALPERIPVAVKSLLNANYKKAIIFHENIDSCSRIFEILKFKRIRAGLYHSGLSLESRSDVLADLREGKITVLVCCKALDEGLNVPDVDLAIIAASTATTRQRIQRIGRVLRKVPGKQKALIYTLACTKGEIYRLKKEQESLPKDFKIKWLIN